MPGITDPSEEYFKNGLWGWVTSRWKKLIGDDAGHLQVDVIGSGLPSGAATSANQSIMITALQLIDDLRAALNSVAADELDVVIDGQSADVEITQTAAADLTPGIMGWDGSAWRKLPLVWGYSSRYMESEASTSVSAGNHNLNFSQVPAGEIWIITAMNGRCSSATPDYIALGVYTGSGFSRLTQRAYSVAHDALGFGGSAVLVAGDYLRAYFNGCGAGDDIYATAFGYKMKVAE